MSAPPPLLEAAAEVQQQLQRLGLRFVVIGGMAVLRWGEARATRDVDFALLCAFGDEHRVIDAVLGVMAGRIEEPGEFARRNRVLLLAAGNGRPIDISLAGLPYEERAIGRASWPGRAPASTGVRSKASSSRCWQSNRTNRPGHG